MEPSVGTLGAGGEAGPRGACPAIQQAAPRPSANASEIFIRTEPPAQFYIRGARPVPKGGLLLLLLDGGLLLVDHLAGRIRIGWIRVGGHLNALRRCRRLGLGLRWLRGRARRLLLRWGGLLAPGRNQSECHEGNNRRESIRSHEGGLFLTAFTTKHLAGQRRAAFQVLRMRQDRARQFTKRGDREALRPAPDG